MLQLCGCYRFSFTGECAHKLEKYILPVYARNCACTSQWCAPFIYHTMSFIFWYQMCMQVLSLKTILWVKLLSLVFLFNFFLMKKARQWVTLFIHGLCNVDLASLECWRVFIISNFTLSKKIRNDIQVSCAKQGHFSLHCLTFLSAASSPACHYLAPDSPL